MEVGAIFAETFGVFYQFLRTKLLVEWNVRSLKMLFHTNMMGVRDKMAAVQQDIGVISALF